MFDKNIIYLNNFKKMIAALLLEKMLNIIFLSYFND